MTALSHFHEYLHSLTNTEKVNAIAVSVGLVLYGFMVAAAACAEVL